VVPDNSFTVIMNETNTSLYFVYILKCADGTYYTGTTNNLTARVEAHNTKDTAAKYTKARRPVHLVYQEEASTKGAALSREYEIKQLTRAEKETLIATLSI